MASTPDCWLERGRNKSPQRPNLYLRRFPPPRYVIVRERGPEHSKTFTVEARVGREWVGQAEGNSKKSAAQKAARDVYERLHASPSE